MQRSLSIIILSALPFFGLTQTLYNNGGTVSVSSGAILHVSGAVNNTSGSTINNSGTLRITGNFTNNGTVSAPAAGILSLQGTTAQTFSGTSLISAKDVVVNNPAGITFNTTLQVDGAMTFTSGLITAASSSAPMIFTANGTVANTPTDASHINGYVRKLGTGTFTFPVGTATKYQPVGVNLSANATGLTAQYVTASAGSGSFSTSGTQATPLVSFNNQEYWDINPVSSATGSVTLYWDGYNETQYAVANRRVAHKVAGAWQNEGGTGSGITASGSITSNSISTWSIFANGSLSFPLPLHWLNFSGSLSAQGTANLSWRVEEKAVARYEVEKSSHGQTFVTIGSLLSKGDGSNAYAFTDAEKLNSNALFRVKQTDQNGNSSYSSVVALTAMGKEAIALYPNPVQQQAVLSVPNELVNTTATLCDASGRVVKSVLLQRNSTTINLTGLQSGLWFLHFADGRVEKISKQ